MNNNNKMIAERYMIVSSLGEGGMADVYLAIDTILNREVAIKVLRGELSKDPVTLAALSAGGQCGQQAEPSQCSGCIRCRRV